MTASLEDLHLLDVPHIVVDDLDAVHLSSQNKHHFLKVRRFRPGQKVTITDGNGFWQECELGNDSLLKLGERQFTPSLADEATICLAMTKSGKPELATQKLTELGVGSIQFFFAQRSVPKWDASKISKNLEKLRIVSKQALAQSKGVWLPRVEIGRTFAELVEEEGMFMADRRGEPVSPNVQKIMIGPEGGWDESEYQSPITKIQIHNLNLRAETAAIVAATKIVSF